MAAENQIVSIEFDVNKRIDAQVEEILDSNNVALPDVNHPLVEDYIRRIEGTYDVSRSKEDTDNAIDLLYIAYNTTPQEEGKIRVEIDKLMSRLIAAQQESEQKMRGASTDAERIIKLLRTLFGDWAEARDSNNPQDLQDFIGEDLVDLAKEIKKRAERVSADLTKIANTYDSIIDDTTKTTQQGELALSARLKNKEKIEKEIAENNAQREKLDSLVQDLQNDIAKYEKMANEYKSQAETAEDRAFIMSIVSVGAQMISSMVPAITAGITGVATGGTSLVAASVNSTARQLINAETATEENDTTAKAIETKGKIADKRTEKTTAEREKAELEKKNQELTAEKEKIEEDAQIDADAKAVQLESLDNRIKDNSAEIKEKVSKISAAETALKALNAALDSLGDNMGKMAEKQEKQATGLRDMQMKMLEKVEAYEKEKRTQAAELVKINALLKGQRTEEETIQLAIQSLGLSLKALKRMREIIVEISFFFKTFANFMQSVVESSTEQSELLQKALDRNQPTKSFTKRIKRNTNDFFITQTAEWQAVSIVSAKFVDNFKDGWSKLNKLSGTYLTGDELKSYLNTSASQIEDIAFKRKQAASAKLEELNRYRDRIQSKA
ncbi:tyrosyl-tRNA deacylase [Pectobacterium odoriferum]|uniref:Tyrosyl-tRNA deacylase n=1 Tax=Pectobacterium odoriferum TaxID=78398 RepID=A0ABD6VTP7_9GAMM|nr:tyrosyl-tRNA deacylase [Pectobacterium odoriferum]POD98536.1 tyrosyl-tRNA deacylase [Pectobacterium odoriferum]POE14586.1 tyrosyl-tRNA deacylase [Pectobacterium odoriferum]POE28455.1 tyrosyl-tRNA deacylase [Pectobacterium odoriferum]POE33604.1 tyrosyl-tRNA deacylase [Pectobacterium odoriferum]POE41436.1 tyrosyl-tRNA deacylase [Pectobacterium odoriferum]